MMECWGAKGGGNHFNSHLSERGGAGGYATGRIHLNAGTNLYVYVGGSGGTFNGAAGWNGGGSSGKGMGNDYGCGGGGATDIRTTSGSWNVNLGNRIIVAGGGGGADNWLAGYGDSNNGGYGNIDDQSGGAGGGLSGCYGIQGTRNGFVNYGYPGTQTSGYAFGYGQSHPQDPGGGGGGWFGGGLGSGGSGYVSGITGCSISSTGYVFESGMTVDGNRYFVSPSGSQERGHWDHGFARISFVEKG